MTERQDHPARNHELPFFARIAAGVGHDIRNVFAIIDQYAGLMDDLLAAAEEANPAEAAKWRALCEKVSRQVKKGTEIMERFGRFAHAADERTASFDLAALLENITALAQRHVGQAGCRLDCELPPESVPVRSSPFGLQYIVFAALDLFLGSPDKGEPIVMRLAVEGTAATLSITGGARIDNDSSDQVAQLSAVVGELNGSVEIVSGEGVLSVTLAIPIE